MSLRVLKEIQAAVGNLNPAEVQGLADRPLSVGLVASTGAAFEAMEEFLLPIEKISDRKRLEVGSILHRTGRPGLPEGINLVLCEEGLACPPHAFTFYRDEPQRTIHEIVSQHPEFELPLARNFYPFRQPVVDRIIHSIAKDNALFALVTALPDVIPSLIELPWSIGEFASDTAFLTINQIRMAFLIAAASDKPVGYSMQKTEIATIVTGAFGWRALARELIGKIPFGGGLIPKGAIAFAGTYVMGLGLDRFYRLGYGLTRAERRESYQAAYERGKGLIEIVLRGIKSRNAA